MNLKWPDVYVGRADNMKGIASPHMLSNGDGRYGGLADGKVCVACSISRRQAVAYMSIAIYLYNVQFSSSSGES